MLFHNIIEGCAAVDVILNLANEIGERFVGFDLRQIGDDRAARLVERRACNCRDSVNADDVIAQTRLREWGKTTFGSGKSGIGNAGTG